MRAVHLVQPGCLELRDVPTPTPGEGEIVVRVEAALTCGTDLKAFRRGHRYIPMPGPFGHEYAGTVVAVGEAVRRFRVGDAVAGVHSAPCFSCYWCRVGQENLCPHLTMTFGAYAEYLRLPAAVVAHNTFLRPANLPAEEAALVEPLACVLHGLAEAPVRPGGT
ncbi:MAG: alcohol dehydrogenase catalytic domain-containing protein, partial [Clostridia bacterium]|nr:alcohol dehydrogenase catalytic domain-containing protein [Clostridia bacterium]